MKRVIALVSLISATTVTLAGDIGFIEDFALSRDRTTALRQLIPGTEDYYYYHCLHFQSIEQFEKIDALIKPWIERFDQTGRLTEIQTRQALLTYDRDPKKSLSYLRDRLQLRFDHQKAISDGPPNLPTVLDQQLISRSRLKADSLARWQNLDNFENSALEWLAVDNLNVERRRNLLQRLSRPDIPNLSKLISDDLAVPNSGGFGTFNIHKQLTIAQLEELVNLRSALLNQAAFVQTYIPKIHPAADEDWRHDSTSMQAFLDRLLTFTRRLSAAHNGLKANVLYHKLIFDRTRGTYDKSLFIEYLKLPRQQHYMAKAMLESVAARGAPADLNADFRSVTLMPSIGIDEPLVREYLKHFFVSAQSPKEFEPYINDVYLKHLFAETKIENGLGEPEQWAAELPPELFRQLKDRIDIDFAPTNKTTFAADEPVKLDLFVKNVPTLIVKVFEVNTQNFYRTQQREVDTDINLDGLVANTEATHGYPEPPLRRVARRFDFPQSTKPGVYVVDFIGAGKSSRALIRKGRLRPLVATTTAGQTINVVDDANRPVKDISIWIGGQEYKSDNTGAVLIPFSTNPGRHPIVISSGEFSCLDYLQHQPEGYELKAGIYVDREALLSQRVAALLIRPGLMLNGNPVSIKLLEEVKLRITATDHDGIATSTEIPNFKLFEDRESVHEFRVPPRLASLAIALQAKVKSLTQSKLVDLTASDQFALNGIDRSDKIEDLHFAKFGNEYVIEVLGRTGEVKPDRPVQVSIKHRDFKEPVHVTLKSDAQGKVRLGALADITTVTTTGPEGTSHNWQLPRNHHTYRQLFHGKAGETITLPYLGSAAAPMREELALFDVRGNLIRGDRFDALAIKDGALELRGLTAGDYDLWLKKKNERIRIRVVDGPVQNGYVLGKLRQMQLPALKTVQVDSLTAEGDTVTVKLRDVSPFTRVHVFAARYRPEYSAFDHFGRVRDAELGGFYPAHAESTYLIGRNIGDEYRYVLDRRQQKKFPGNMLDRPALLLNAWAVRSTETGEQLAEGGEEFRRQGTPPASMPAPKPSERGPMANTATASVPLTPNLDFLADAAAILHNLVPDKDGVIKIGRDKIGPHAMIHVVVIDPVNTTVRTIALAEPPLRALDLRLRAGLDPQKHFTQQKQVSILKQGDSFVLDDAVSSRFEAYDSMQKLYSLYATLSKDPKLAEFAFILTWPTLKAEEKRAQYSKYACHELNFFLKQRDPDFFQNVVRPFLANKKDKTFMDRWLLEDNLSEYMQPWNFGRLSTVERILLAQRIPNEPAKTSRHLNDLWRLLPPNMDRTRVLFESAIKGSELATEEQLGARRLEVDTPLLAEAKPHANTPDTFGGLPAARGDSSGIAGGGAAGRPGSGEKAKDGVEAGEFKAKSALADRGAEALNKKLESRTKLGEELHYFGDERARKSVAALYRRLPATQEWAENNYYHLPIQQQIAALVSVNPFWLDYSRHDGKSPFLSKHFADASRNFTEMMFALSVIELPFTADKHTVKFDGGRMTFTPAGPVIAFHEEVRPVGPAGEKNPILVSQNFYRHGDRYREEGGEKIDKFVTGEFVIGTVYGSQVVVTNPSSSRQRLSVLVQVPVGAVPVANGQYTRTVLLDLEPYRTATVDYLFYFPKPGRSPYFPVHVAKNEALVANAAPANFDVVAKPSKLDTESWDYVSQNGTNEQVLAMLARENASALDLEKIAFRLKDANFFAAVVQLLQERHVYQPTIWSYGLLHNAVTIAREFLLHQDQLVAECGGPIVSPLLTIDPIVRHTYEHLEYKPLVNARAHSLGQRRQIVNGRFNEQYHHFMHLLSFRRQLSDDDRLAVVYYLLLQDRIDEAVAMFVEVNADRLATRMQYDYCAAYLDMFSDEPQKARSITAKYVNHPVDRWRNAFSTMAMQLDEIEGKGMKIADADDRSQKQGQLAANEPAVDFTLDNKAINLTWQNVENVRINYYLMDVELLFSRNPFVQQSGGQMAFIRPNMTQDVKLAAGQNKLGVPLPENLLKRNVLVEVTAGGKTRSMPYYANAMDVKVTENYGQLRVTEAASEKPLAKVYVKTYVRLADGQVKFYKDGYTDHRGRFDYASVSTPEKTSPNRFAVLVLSDEHGALIREAAPPQQ